MNAHRSEPLPDASDPLALLPATSVNLSRSLTTIGQLRARIQHLPDSLPLVIGNNRWAGVGTSLGLAEAKPGIRAVCFRFFNDSHDPCPWCEGEG